MQYSYSESANESNRGIFCEKLSAFIANGWDTIRDLTSEEKKAADALCVIDASSLPEVDRFFHALTQTVLKHGFLGITIEHIAEELGMAKSSLYSHYDSKDELLAGIVKTEMAYFVAVLSDKLEGITDISIAVYVFLHVVYAYLVIRPELIIVILWHFSHGNMLGELFEEFPIHDISNGLLMVGTVGNPDFGVELPPFSTAVWLASLPSSLIIHEHLLLGKARERNEVYDLITALHHQMGHKLDNESDCVLT
jgi:AcrR family transcriptional regulator